MTLRFVQCRRAALEDGMDITHRLRAAPLACTDAIIPSVRCGGSTGRPATSPVWQGPCRTDVQRRGKGDAIAEVIRVPLFPPTSPAFVEWQRSLPLNQSPDHPNTPPGFSRKNVRRQTRRRASARPCAPRVFMQYIAPPALSMHPPLAELPRLQASEFETVMPRFGQAVDRASHVNDPPPRRTWRVCGKCC